MESTLPEWVVSTISLSSFFLLWLPFIALLVFFLIYAIFVSVQNIHLEKDYLKSLSNEDRKIIEDYKENTNYLRLRRRLKRIRKNLNINK